MGKDKQVKAKLLRDAVSNIELGIQLEKNAFLKEHWLKYMTNAKNGEKPTNEDWQQFVFEAHKEAKIKILKESAIESLVASKLQGTGIKYAVEKQRMNVKFFFNILDKAQVEMSLSHKKFAEQVDNVISTVVKFKELVESTNMRISIKKIDHYIHWK